ncbi:MAG: apolipoprotein N-acyltransferase [Corynebacterium sp.]|nr:apolipoprotein N-acyltransferase [Corynebacterium sp.]
MRNKTAAHWLLLLRLASSAAGGAGVYLSYEPNGLWWAAIVGIALLFAALSPWTMPYNPVGGKEVMGIAFIHSLVTYLLLLPWIGELVGSFPYIALAVWLSFYALILGWAGAYVARFRWGFAVFPFLYAAVELLRSSVPFGGFSWVRLAWGQIDGPLAGLAQWGGPVLVTVAAVLVGTSLCVLGTAIGSSLVVPRSSRPVLSLDDIAAPTSAGIVIVLTALAGWGASVVLNPEISTVKTVRVAAIQGNVPRLGLDFNSQRRAVLFNHVEVTKKLAQAGEKVDVVVWPENSSDVNPFTDEQARQLIDEATTSINAPILVGTITRDEVGERNTMQVFNADGSTGDFHYKKFLQPFGETMPMRDIFAVLSDYVDLAGDFKPGNGPGVVDINGIVLGVATCYEVSFDAAFRTAINNGATLLATPTNNATFGFSDMTYQQLAMSRMRAIETDRVVVVPATSGVSAIVLPDGTVSQHTEIFQPGYLIQEVPLRDSITPAVHYGWWIQTVFVIVGVLLSAGMIAKARFGYNLKFARLNHRL